MIYYDILVSYNPNPFL